MNRLLFTVESRFPVRDRRFVAAAGLGKEACESLEPGSYVELRRPDGSRVSTFIAGMEEASPADGAEQAHAFRYSVLLADVREADVPAGTEVWLASSASPLAAPFDVEPPSRFERACMWFPVIGWIIAGALEKGRREPKEHYIARQIAARTAATREAWREDPRRQAVAEAISRVIQEEFGWPNAHFLPDDRLDLLMWGGDSFSPVTCAFAIEKRLGHRLNKLDETTPELWDMTLGQLVDHVLRLPRKCAKCGYDLRASPDRCPECGTPGPWHGEG